MTNNLVSFYIFKCFFKFSPFTVGNNVIFYSYIRAERPRVFVRAERHGVRRSRRKSRVRLPLNVGGGVRLMKPAKLCMCTQTHYKHDEDGHIAPGVRGHGSVPLSHSENIVTRIGLHTHTRILGIISLILDEFSYGKAQITHRFM